MENPKVIREVNRLIKRKCHIKALDLIRRYKLSGYTITKSRAKREYGLTEQQIMKLPYNEADNPYYKIAEPMKLYLKAQCELKAAA